MAASVAAPVKLLFISGSLRHDGTNGGVIRAAQKLLAPEVASVTVVNIRLPLYDGDIEAKGLPEDVKTIREQFADADGVFISTPEYNGYFSSPLKNALDWVSRPMPTPTPLVALPIAVASAAAGGGAEAQEALNKFILRLKAVPVPVAEPIKIQSYYVTPANFTATGDLTPEALATQTPRIQATLDALVVAAKARQAAKAAAAAAPAVASA